ncbi:hypothetical protein GCM10023195_84940 [Actinoallomurus liliacearum]|uniref:ESX-1 secretion-associated protein n=1 Tax=Actinoallomurus liliacearum TaxID=1080073 RepID=A0ABP8TXE8_9ACTN
MTETPPSIQDLRFALGKFTSDAAQWDAHSRSMRQAEQAADALHIDSLTFGPAALFGMAETYRRVQQMIIDRCGEAAIEFGAIADNLIKARNAYQREEDNNVHAANKAW